MITLSQDLNFYVGHEGTYFLVQNLAAFVRVINFQKRVINVWAVGGKALQAWYMQGVDGLWVRLYLGGFSVGAEREGKLDGKRRREKKEEKTGSGAEPRRNFLKTRFYPLSGPRSGLSFAFLYSSHRDLPFGETLSSRGRLDAEIDGSGQLRLGQRGSGFFNPDQTLAVYPTG